MRGPNMGFYSSDTLLLVAGSDSSALAGKFVITLAIKHTNKLSFPLPAKAFEDRLRLNLELSSSGVTVCIGRSNDRIKAWSILKRESWR